MDSDSDEEKYYVSEDTEDDKPHPPSRRSSISEPLRGNYYFAGCGDELLLSPVLRKF